MEPSSEELRKISEEAKRVLRCKMVYARKFESVQGPGRTDQGSFLKVERKAGCHRNWGSEILGYMLVNFQSHDRNDRYENSDLSHVQGGV